ncbi:hypothetical protein LPJ66_009492 [Kickxella alabastrina]|uniref:Uncharacterized protein n=1 Tax=Kickxella alabastrina TaxID=61397 RepID=A0ACC1I3P4_9FUNG|nr:hypothetical protein LPJ66_009492 [Kickxella alabastrina]
MRTPAFPLGIIDRTHMDEITTTKQMTILRATITASVVVAAEAELEAGSEGVEGPLVDLPLLAEAVGVATAEVWLLSAGGEAAAAAICTPEAGAEAGDPAQMRRGHPPTQMI